MKELGEPNLKGHPGEVVGRPIADLTDIGSERAAIEREESAIVFTVVCAVGVVENRAHHRKSIARLIAGTLVTIGSVCFSLLLPSEVLLAKDGRMAFRSALRSISVHAKDVTTVNVGAQFAVFEYESRCVVAFKFMTDFEGLIEAIKRFNPSLEVVRGPFG